MKIISGQFVPRDLSKRRDIVFLGERASLYFVRHPKERSKGNYNATAGDFLLQNWIRKYFKRAVYVTDMIKTEGRGGKHLKEWYKNPIYVKILHKEIKKLNPKVIVAMSNKVVQLFENDPALLKYKNRVRSIYPASYVARWNKFGAWDSQFKKILNELR